MNTIPSGLYRPLVWSAAVLLLASGALLSIQMVSAVVGPFRLAELGERDPRAVVALWRDAATPVGAALHGPLAGELVAAGRSIRELASLEGADPGRVGTVVLDEPRALAPRELAALRAYLEGGGGVVLLGSVAVRSPDGAWRGYAEMRALLGAEVVPLEGMPVSALVAARRGPIAAALLPRQRIAVTPEPGLPALRSNDAELRWITESGFAGAASVRRGVGAGRLAWIAVPPEQAGRDESDRRSLRRVLEAAVAWTSRMPWVEVLPWPDGARFAALFDRNARSAEPGGRTAAVWAHEIDAAAADGALARLPLPDPATTPSLEDLVADALGTLGRRGGWTPTRSELATWTRQRSSIQASVRPAGPRRVVVEVTNHAVTPATGVVLRVYLNEPVTRVKVGATELLQENASTRLASGAERLDLVLPPLAARASAAWSLDFEPAS